MHDCNTGWADAVCEELATGVTVFTKLPKATKGAAISIVNRVL